VTESSYANAPLPPTASFGPPRRRRPRTGLVALSLASALVGGGAGAAVSQAMDDPRSAPAAAAPTANTTAASASVDSPSGSVTEVAGKVLPSVVSISVRGASSSGVGTGFVYDGQGHIVTNNHVVAPAAGGGAITVRFSDGRDRAATIVGRDPVSDLAVLVVKDTKGLITAALGRSAGLAVGDPVIAFGSPLGFSGTVTSGIVSALDRPVNVGSESGGGAETTSTVLNAIQTDAAINPGNSGGPLVNLRGAVVGVNSAIASLGASTGAQAGSIGLGFSIPVDQVKPIVDELITSGRAKHAYLGVQVKDGGGTASGALVQVTAGGVAEKAGLRTGDLVTSVGNHPVATADALVASVRSHRPGDTVTITYSRGGTTRTATVQLATAPY